MNVTAKDVCEFFTPFPNRHAGLDAAVGELLQPKDTSSLLVNCAIVSLYALGLFALIRHRLQAGATGAAIAARRVAIWNHQRNILDGASKCMRQCQEGDREEALKTLELIGVSFMDMRECVEREGYVDILTGSYDDVIRASEAFHPLGKD